MPLDKVFLQPRKRVLNGPGQDKTRKRRRVKPKKKKQPASQPLLLSQSQSFSQDLNDFCDDFYAPENDPLSQLSQYSAKLTPLSPMSHKNWDVKLTPSPLSQSQPDLEMQSPETVPLSESSRKHHRDIISVVKKKIQSAVDAVAGIDHINMQEEVQQLARALQRALTRANRAAAVMQPPSDKL